MLRSRGRSSRRLREEQGYETLRAPFAGTVTARYADPGALVQSAATSQTSALPVVTVSQIGRLRVLAYLDQEDAALVHPGTPATVTLTERPDVHIAAPVARMSGELDPKTRKMLAEVDVDDRDGVIVPGSFVQVQIDVSAPALPQAPAEALVVRGGKTFVAVVDESNRVHFAPVTVASNDGKSVMFSNGVAPGQKLALSIGSAVAEGAPVQVDTAAGGSSATSAGPASK